MYELNEQELEQVAGGQVFQGTTSAAGGEAEALVGLAASSSKTHAVNFGCYSASSASNKSYAIGLYVAADSAAASTSGLSVD
jgi:hypothetical protein